jgi:hypothetical protein
LTHAGTHRPYRPSNGTEGDYFVAEWCSNCALADFDGEGCMINLRAYAFNINEPEYPAEWNYTNAGTPQCTAYVADTTAGPRCDMTIDMFDDTPGVTG